MDRYHHLLTSIGLAAIMVFAAVSSACGSSQGESFAGGATGGSSMYGTTGSSASAADRSGGRAGATAAKRKRVRFRWRKDRGTRTKDGSVPYIHKVNGRSYRLYFCGPGGILSATSRNAFSFTKEEGVRIEQPPDDESQRMVCDPTIVKLSDGRVRMYYKGSTGPGGPGQAVHKVFSAVSSDGVNFEKEGLRIDSEKTGDGGWASVPEAIRLPDGRVRIYYVSGASSAKGGTVSAISKDGLNFTRERGTRLKGLVDPAVIRLARRQYLMLAVVLPSPDARKKQPLAEGIYSFTSRDGLTFKNRRTVLREQGVYDPAIVKLSKRRYRVFYGKDLGTQGRPNVVTKSITGRLRG